MTLGKQGENLAVRYLQANNYRILARNFFSSYGELDIIAQQEDTLIFIEVKTRTSTFDQAENSVSAAKQQKMLATAELFLQQHPACEEMPTRFDVISVIFRNSQYNLKHLKDAFY